MRHCVTRRVVLSSSASAMSFQKVPRLSTPPQAFGATRKTTDRQSNVQESRQVGANRDATRRDASTRQ